MPIIVPAIATGFADRLRVQPEDALEAFAEAEIIGGRPWIFAADDDTARFRQHVATGLEIQPAAADIFIVGSARTGFSLDPETYFVPFQDRSDVDVAVVHAEMFDRAWQTMLRWDYLTM